MYYILFHYKKGNRERDFHVCRSEQETIDFLHEHYKKMDVYRIIETARSYRLGLVVTEEIIKSVLEPEEETEPRAGQTVMCKSEIISDPIKIPEEAVLTEEEILKQNKEALEEIEKEPIVTAQDLTDDEILKKEALEEIERKGKIHPYLRKKGKSKSAMEKIADDIEGEQKDDRTDEEKTKDALEKASQLIKREKEKAKVDKEDWKKCSVCKRCPIAPWNKKGICSSCQKRRKTNQPYVRKN